jgi:hypothetical protein
MLKVHCIAEGPKFVILGQPIDRLMTTLQPATTVSLAGYAGCPPFGQRGALTAFGRTSTPLRFAAPLSFENLIILELIKFDCLEEDWMMRFALNEQERAPMI